MIEMIGIFFCIVGFIIGLGAVIVIDMHGLLARNSTYWTLATIRSHKVTKPLIWVGTAFVILGGVLLYAGKPFVGIPVWHTLIACILVVNGVFLSFSVSPYLLQREVDRKSEELLPKTWQQKVLISFIISDIGWWSAVILFVWYLSTRIA